jgi:chromosome segregation ATPase
MPDSPATVEVLNERMFRLETEVDTIKHDLSDQKITIARITEQVAAHEHRGEERHQQVLTAIRDLRDDYRGILKQQAEDAREEREAHSKAAADRLALLGKIALGVLGIVSTLVAGIYGFAPSKPKTESSPAPVSAPAAEHP